MFFVNLFRNPIAFHTCTILQKHVYSNYVEKEKSKLYQIELGKAKERTQCQTEWVSDCG